MLYNNEFIRQSLETHLFFTRIMKEHSFFLEIGFTPKDRESAVTADGFRMGFDKFLSDVVSISNGVVSSDVLNSGEIVTPYTARAEMISSYYTGIKIPTEITEAEMRLMDEELKACNSMLEERVFGINDRAIDLITGLIQFKTNLLSKVMSCKMFTVNYPLLIDHILREAKLYLSIVKTLQKYKKVDFKTKIYEQEAFWSRIMAEHSKFIRGLLDPTEDELMSMANNFANQFDQLTKEAMQSTMKTSNVTEETLKSTMEIAKFKEQGTKGLLECKIKSIIIPLLGDHTLREANHYLRLLKVFEKSM